MCVSANRLSFSQLFGDILLVLNVTRLCVVVDSLISATKVFEGKTQVCGRVRLSCCTKIICPSNKNVSSMFSLADCALEDRFST